MIKIRAAAKHTPTFITFARLQSGWYGWGFEIIVPAVDPDRSMNSTNEAMREESRQILRW
ncbi:MAG: hypothetical protein U9Q68_10085 [Euryarchaeota archaeon]|nr:hypothetical protein [Euryarchaeota archaeon]